MSFNNDFQYRLRDSVTSRLLNETNWAETALGPIKGWPDALKSAIALCLNSQFPMTIVWGDQFVNIYNDGYLPIVGSKHPDVFGVPAKDAYPEIWELFLKESFQRVYGNGEVVWRENFLLPLIRDKTPEECYFTFCYSPLSDAVGSYQGVASVATDTSEMVVYHRRSQVIKDLMSNLVGEVGKQALVFALVNALQKNPMDAEDLVVFSLSAGSAACALWASNANIVRQFEADQELQTIHDQLIRASDSPFVFHGDSILAFDLKTVDATNELICLFFRPNALVKKDQDFWRFVGDIVAKVQTYLDHQFTQKSKLLQLRRERDNRDILYQLIFENSQDGIMFTAPDGRILAANPASCERLGYTEAEIIAAGRSKLAEPSIEVERFLEERLKLGRATAELIIRRKDGSTFPGEVSSIVFHDDFSNEERSVLIFRDVSLRKLVEERGRTAAKLEAVGRLTGGISHDFNNYLNVIINSADELQELLPAGESHHELAELILKSSLKAADLTRQLLSFSRREKLIPKNCPICGLIEDMDQIISRAIGEHIAVSIDSAAPEVEVRIDAAQFQSAVLNLVLNAADAMQDGGSLTIRCNVLDIGESDAGRLEVNAGHHVVVSVIDTGKGIPAAELNKVFEPFFTTKKDTGGTGLGLSMVHGFVKMSAGGIEIKSEVDVGTAVHLYFPQAEISRENATQDERVDTTKDFSGMHVFLVEDNDLVAQSVMLMLKRKGLLVDAFGTCETALKVLASGKIPDCIITDVVLGAGMDGWSFARKVRQDLPEIPIIVMSGFMDNSVVQSENTLDLPILRKPFREAELFSLIERASIESRFLT